MARSVVALAHSLDVVAFGAGIEQAGQREALRELGCDGGQGMLVGEVMQAPQIAERLRRAD